MEWYVADTCENSPKNKMIVDWVKAFVGGEDCSDFLTGETQLQIGSKNVSKIAIPKEITEMRIHTAITHGKEGAIHGQAATSGKVYDFALFFEFSLGKQPKLKKAVCIF